MSIVQALKDISSLEKKVKEMEKGIYDRESHIEDITYDIYKLNNTITNIKKTITSIKKPIREESIRYYVLQRLKEDQIIDGVLSDITVTETFAANSCEVKYSILNFTKKYINVKIIIPDIKKLPLTDYISFTEREKNGIFSVSYSRFLDRYFEVSVDDAINEFITYMNREEILNDLLK